ncbi:MAG: phospholipid/glycerol acyltransferase [Deltaproteobacteria bacterium]|nr:phospholipid/glycerol acyltransferase [Deltaproteobacteria bacterium]
MSAEDRRGGMGGNGKPPAAPPVEVALGSNPFVDALSGEVDPLEAWLAALDRLAVKGEDVVPLRPQLVTPSAAAATPAAQPTPIAEPRAPDVELPLPQSALARLVGEEANQKLASLLGRIDGWDRFGLSRSALAQAFPFFYALYKLYFRVQSADHAKIPSTGPIVLAANHGGLLPFDGAMAVLDVLLHTEPPRLPRAIVERWAGTLPFVNVFFARVGQVVGTHENFARLLGEGEAVLVFPEGVEGIRKPITQRYRLQHFHVGFVEHALRARAPIVPMAILGSDDQAPILFDVKPLARLLGLPTAPITPTFPWFGPLGLLPYPVRYRIVYGEPLCFHERFDSEAALDPGLVRALANQVRRAIQTLVDKNRA